MPLYCTKTSSIFHDIDVNNFWCITDQHTCQLSHHMRPISHSTSIPRSCVTHQSPQTTLLTCFKDLTQPVHQYQCDRNGMMGSTYWSFIGLRLTFGLGIIDPSDIANRSFSIPLESLTGLTLWCFVLYLFLLLLPLETQHYLYSLP